MKILIPKCPHFDLRTNFHPYLKSYSCHTKHSTALIFNIGIPYQLDYTSPNIKENTSLKKVTSFQTMDQL